MDRRARTEQVSKQLVRPILAGLVLSSILWGAAAIHSSPVADAHAVLQSSSPSDQSVLSGSPGHVRLTFGEAVTLVPGSLRVFDANGSRVDQGVAKHGASSSEVVVALKPNLPTGSYAVAWRVISADTHPVHGGFVFSVRSAGKTKSLDKLINQSPQRSDQVIGAVLRGVGYLTTFGLVGAAIFIAFVQRRNTGDARITNHLAALAAVALVAQVVQIPVSAALATGEGLKSLFSPGVFAEVLGQGTWITLAGVAFAALAALVAVIVTGVWRRGMAVASLLLLTGAFVASGHTRSTDPTWLISIVDAVHIAAGAVWFGGLGMLLRSLWVSRRAEPPEDPVVAAEEVVGFSRIATITVFAVGIAGVVLAYVEIRSLRGLFSTAYGRLVLAKFALLIVVGVVASFNHYRLVPALVKRPDRPVRWRYLRRTLVAEVMGLIAIFGLTGVLVNSVPSRTALASKAVYSATARVGSGSINLVIDPARTGPTALHLYLLDAHGRPDNHVKSMAVSLIQDQLSIGPIDHTLRRAGPGHFVTNGILFTVPGKWIVTMQVRVDEFTENSAILSVNVAP